ncbi:MAG: TetR/AcrR family transcriptional regulator [Gemmatimonadota bacterium]|nr:TetR/AcrR family transcriptional regulator [Gemmatimonadota bacterium]
MADATHVNPPQQARSRRTLERIVKAALAILEEEGTEGLTVQAVVARAGSSVGSFYARFGGKDDLLDYLEERVWDEARERWQEALENRSWEGLDLPELATGAVKLLADAHRSRATYLRALDRMGAGERGGYASFRRHVLTGLTELLLERRKEITHPDPELAVRLALAALSGAVESGDPATGEPFDRDALGREGRWLLLAYLTEHGAEPGERVDGARPGASAAEDADGATGRAPDGDGTETTDPARDDEDEEEDEDVDFFDVWG